MNVRDRLSQLEEQIGSSFPKERMKFNWQIFENHAELWVYVLESTCFDDVQTFCREIAQQEIAVQQPEIWILTNSWTGPWPGGASDAELKQRRDAFRQRHNMVRAGV